MSTRQGNIDVTRTDSSDEVAAALQDAVSTLEEANDTDIVVKVAVGDVVSTAYSVGGDVEAAVRDATHLLVTQVADQGLEGVDISNVAESAVEAALVEPLREDGVDIEAAAAAAMGAVEAAYQVGEEEGAVVRKSVLRRVLDIKAESTPALERRLTALAERLAGELPQGRMAWRGTAMSRAFRLLMTVGTIDMAASLAYFATLSFFPVIALLILAIASLGDSESMRDTFVETLGYYFPTSDELIRQAVDGMLNASLAISVVSVLSLLIGANGMFSAANRAIGRVFEETEEGVARATLRQTLIATLVAVLLLVSVGVTVLLHAATQYGTGLMEAGGGPSVPLIVVLGTASTIIPLLATIAIFATVYRQLPSTRVDWRDAAFGAVIAIVLFEVGKHLFFWFSAFATQRSIIYGPLASVVVLLMWTLVSGVIFLYGAALTRTTGEVRPHAPAEILSGGGPQL